MQIAVMQPTYLPWLGYLDLADLVDTFVLLGDVEFSKQSWQQRNRVVGSDGLQWLTIPVITKGRSGQLVNEVELVDDAWVNKHMRTLRHLYARATHVGLVDDLESQLTAAAGSGLLHEVTETSIAWLCEQLGVATRVAWSTSLDLGADRIGRLVRACEVLGADAYVTPPGAVDYLAGGGSSFTDAGVEVLVHEYEHPTYQQCHPGFAPYASGLDLILNHGPDAADVLRQGRREPVPLASWRTHAS